MKKLYPLLFHLVVLLSTNSLFAQNKKPAYLRFYRNDKILCNSLNFDIQLNKIDVFTLRPTLKSPGALEYAIYSTGRLNIAVKNWMNDWTSTTALQIEPGEIYYIKIDCFLGGIMLSTNKANGQYDWPVVSMLNLTSLAEDPANPLIQPAEGAVVSNVQQVVRVDTIRQVVYVNQEKKYSYQPFSDVDLNVPYGAPANELQFALIIGNEDYKNYQPDLAAESNVPFARNDACAFKEYAIKTLGIPEKNITLLLDGTYGQISQGLTKMNLLAKNTNGKASFVFYYAGHGMPDEITKEPYLVPVDISGANISNALKLKEVYAKLTEFPSERVCVFLDACFTGGARAEGLIAGRGISIKPKEQLLKGNIVVFNSSSGNQSSMAYSDQKHGLFTYYLLKKLQESKGDIGLKEFSTSLKEKVGLESLIINNKEQNPQTQTSAEASAKWEKWKFIK